MKHYLLLACILVGTTVAAQTRTNRPPFDFDETSKQLTRAVGWVYNDPLGVWTDYENCIEKDPTYKDKYKLLQGSYMQSHREQSFIHLQAATYNTDSTKYYFLIISKYRGNYKYPNIQQEWEIFATYDLCIFTQSEWVKLFNLTNDVDTISGKIIRNKYAPKYTPQQLAQQYLLNKLEYNYTEKCAWYLYKSTESTIRFLLPIVYNRFDRSDITTQYFEVAPADFDNLLIL